MIAVGILSVLCAGLLIALTVLIYLYRNQSRVIRRQTEYIRELLRVRNADYIRELLMVRNANIHRVSVPEKTMQTAIKDAVQKETDYKPMIAPYESRKSTI